jgi:hypothetical protein
MALICLSESEARTLCEKDLEKVNPPEIISKTKMMEYVLQVTDRSKDSRTARFVIEVLTKSPVPIEIRRNSIEVAGGGEQEKVV